MAPGDVSPARTSPPTRPRPRPPLLFLLLCFKSPPLRRQPPREDGMTPSASRNDDAPCARGALECGAGLRCLKGAASPSPAPGGPDGRGQPVGRGGGRRMGPPSPALPQPPVPHRRGGGGALPAALRRERGRCRPRGWRRRCPRRGGGSGPKRRGLVRCLLGGSGDGASDAGGGLGPAGRGTGAYPVCGCRAAAARRGEGCRVCPAAASLGLPGAKQGCASLVSHGSFTEDEARHVFPVCFQP